MSGGQIRSRYVAVAIENEWTPLPLEGARAFAFGWGSAQAGQVFPTPMGKAPAVTAAGAVRILTASGESIIPFPAQRTLVDMNEPIIRAELMIFNNGDASFSFLLTAIYGKVTLTAIDG